MASPLVDQVRLVASAVPKVTLLVFWRLVPEIIQKNIHAHLAGNFAGGLPAHAVTDHKNSIARIEAKIVFVVRAHAPDVGFAGNFHRKRHRWVPCLER